MFTPFASEIVGGRRMTGMVNGTNLQPEFVIVEHAMSDGSTLYEHQWCYPAPEPSAEASPETDSADAE